VASLQVGAYVLFMLAVFGYFMYTLFRTDNNVVYRVALIVGVIGDFLGLSLLLVLLFYSYKKWHESGHTVTNIILSGMIIFYVVLNVSIYLPQWLPSDIWQLRGVISWLALFVLWQFLRFFITSIIYGFVIKRPEIGPLVVLGGGLVDGYFVGRIVSQRIKAAVKDANQMTPYPMIVFSGGQGEDELVSEAQAMRDYAVKELHVPIEKTMLEDQSRNTFENIRNSSEILHTPFTFYSSDYHILRGATLAQQQKVTANGRGGKSPFPYRIIAFLREFSGVMNIKKKAQIIWGSLLFFVAVAVVTIVFR